jgi:hypothetical protein
MRQGPDLVSSRNIVQDKSPRSLEVFLFQLIDDSLDLVGGHGLNHVRECLCADRLGMGEDQTFNNGFQQMPFQQ